MLAAFATKFVSFSKRPCSCAQICSYAACLELATPTELEICIPDIAYLSLSGAVSAKNSQAEPQALVGPVSATTGYGWAASRSSGSVSRGSPLLPIAAATFLSNPSYLARHTGDCRNNLRNSSGESSANVLRSVPPWLRSNLESLVMPARRFHGHTSWQMSHPKTVIAQSSLGTLAGSISPRFSIVRYEMQRRASSSPPACPVRHNRLRRTAVDAARTSSAAIRRRASRGERNRKQQFAEKKPGALPVD